MIESLEKKTRCWNCGKESDRVASPTGGASPKDGDVSFCIYCSEFAIFDSSFVDGARKPSPIEKDIVDGDPTVQRLRRLWAIRFPNGASDDAVEEWRSEGKGRDG